MSTAEYQRAWRAKHSQGKPVGRPVTATCPSVSAYKRHQRHGETPCDGCRQAWADWQREYYRKRKGK